MAMYNKIFNLFIALCVGVMLASAQAISVPYEMGFELSDSLELKNWVFNPGPKAPLCADAWYVGTAAHNSGKQALYVSCDSGYTALFDSTLNVQYVYRDFTLPKSTYVLSFDWRCMGSDDACLYAGLAPVSSTLNNDMKASNTSSQVPASIANWCKKFGPLKGTSLWKNESMQFTSNGTSTYRLYFVWSNSNKKTNLAMPLAGCIDNVQITSARCPKPTSLSARATCDSLWLNWEGSSEFYCLEYRRRGKDKWTKITGIVAKETMVQEKILEGLDEGLYDFRIRGVCGGETNDTSAYTYLNSFAIFCPEKHCVNYVDLYNTENVLCTYGTCKNPDINQGVVDYGPDDKFSRHTVNWEPDVYDPRTCNELPTVPDGELASVRLGNWNNGAEGESVSFNYVADLENAAILLLKYAVVLEDPGHGANDNPRFMLEILNENGQLISPTCGYADFYADASRQDKGWHSCGKAPGSSSAISWREWTTIGLNLEEAGVQDGEQLTIRLTTKDCAWSAHFGYAYFTLGCASAKLVGTSCGSEAKLSVAAPSGFKYEWYNKYDELVDTTQELSVDPSDTTTYRCHLCYKENAECSFDLYSSVRPRFPISEFTYSYEPSDCENKVRFINLSHIMTMFNGDTVHHYDEPCDSYEWDYGTGDIGGEINPVYIFPQKGGTYPVILYAGISEGRCIDEDTIWITLPALGDTLISEDTVLCEGSYIIFGKDNPRYIGQEGIYRDTLKSIAGCDSVSELVVQISPQSHITTPDTIICKGQILTLDGKVFGHSTSAPFPRFFKNQYGCDSTRTCNVTVLDSILPKVVMKDVIKSQKNSGAFTITGSGFDYYELTHNGTTTHHNPSETQITGLNGGTFYFEFFNQLQCSADTTLYMSYPCLEMIFQRWGDVLSVYNSDALGGAQYKAFQWLKDSVAIPDATLSYYYEAGGLDLNADYLVQVTTMNDSTFISCPYRPEPYQAPKSNAQKRVEDGMLIIEINNVKYNAQGVRIKEED